MPDERVADGMQLVLVAKFMKWSASSHFQPPTGVRTEPHFMLFSGVTEPKSRLMISVMSGCLPLAMAVLMAAPIKNRSL